MAKRKTNEETLGDAIDRLLKTYRLDGKMLELSVIESWSELMGKAISNRTTHIFMKNGKLTVKLSSSVLRNELMLSREKIIAMINSKVGHEVVKELELK